MSPIAHTWSLTVERGPNCLVLQMHTENSVSNDGLHLADTIWMILEKHFVYRVVIEMERVDELSDYLLRELIALSHRLRSREGMLRLCGLSDANRRVLRKACLDGRLPSYETRHHAVITAGSTATLDRAC